MLRFLFQRFIQSLALLLGVLILVFGLVRLTGDPAALMLSREASMEQRAAFRVENGLDRPLPEQFVAYVGNVARGNFGLSLSLGLPNLTLIGQRLPATVELAITSLLLAIVIAVPLGLLAGMLPRSPFDFVVRMLSLIGQTFPSFWLGMIFILIFAVQLRILPSFGRDGFRSLILPAMALALVQTGQLTRLTRATVMEVRQEAFIRTAHSKGLSPRHVGFRHILPNVTVTLVSVLGINFTYLLGGSVYIETVFAWPGLGSLLNNAINDSDFQLVQAITLFIALFVIGINLLTDLLYGWLDPRIRQT